MKYIAQTISELDEAFRNDWKNMYAPVRSGDDLDLESVYWAATPSKPNDVRICQISELIYTRPVGENYHFLIPSTHSEAQARQLELTYRNSSNSLLIEALFWFIRGINSVLRTCDKFIYFVQSLRRKIST